MQPASHFDGLPARGLVRISCQVREDAQTLTQPAASPRRTAHARLFHNYADRDRSSWCSSLENSTTFHFHKHVHSILQRCVAALASPPAPRSSVLDASCCHLSGTPGHRPICGAGTAHSSMNATEADLPAAGRRMDSGA